MAWHPDTVRDVMRSSPYWPSVDQDEADLTCVSELKKLVTESMNWKRTVLWSDRASQTEDVTLKRKRECRCGSESSQQQIIVSKQPLNPRGKPVCQSCFNLPYYDILSLVLRPPRRMQQNQNGGRSELILQSFKLKNIHLWYSFKSRAKLGFSLSTV